MKHSSRGFAADGAAIHQHRHCLGLTQSQLAVAARCDVKTVRRAEQGKNVDLFILQKIAAALEVQFLDIVPEHNGGKTKQRVNRQTVCRWRDALAAGEVPGVLSTFHNAGLLRVGGAADTPVAGRFQGQQQLRRHYELFFETFEVHRFDTSSCSLDAIGDRVYLDAAITLKCKANGSECGLETAQRFQLANGKITELAVYCDTLAVGRLLSE